VVDLALEPVGRVEEVVPEPLARAIEPRLELDVAPIDVVDLDDLGQATLGPHARSQVGQLGVVGVLVGNRPDGRLQLQGAEPLQLPPDRGP